MDLINLSLGSAGIIGLLGYAVVFLGLVLLMIVIMIMAGIFIKKAKASATEVAEAAPVKAAEPVKAPAAPGTAGDVKLYDTDPKDAAMIMAIVADTLGKPLNELRFKSIKEVKE